MSTKNSPGAFRCYQAALPDEPIFTILGRDPAAPATLRFWANERRELGKTESADDQDRIEIAEIEADAMLDWREANLAAGPDGEPLWKVLQMNDDDLGPVRALPDVQYLVPAEREGDEAVRVSIEWLRHLTGQLTRGDITRDFYAELIEAACNSPDRRERVVPVEEAAYDAARRDERRITMMSAITNAIHLLDDMVAPRPNKKLSTRTYDRVEAIRRTLFNGLQNAPMIDPAKEKKADETAQRMGFEMPEYLIPFRGLPSDDEFVVDSQPNDLAHGPEVPPHRFSTFRKGKRYAYARGLEISPMHLPTALDAMAEDGWVLLAIFGQTDSKHVGFIFERQQSVTFSTAGSSLSWSKDGVPVVHTPCGVDDRGRGLEP